MPLVPIDSIDDPRLDPYRQLKMIVPVRRQGLFIAEGDKLAERLLESGHETLSLLVAENHAARIAARTPPEVPLYVVRADQIEELVGFNFHRGVLACGRRRPGPPLAEFLASRPGRLTFVVCPDVQDPENLGAIIRLSRAFGVDGLVLGGQCANPFSRRVLRVSMGTVFRLPLFDCLDLSQAFAEFHQAGVQTAATVLDPTAETLAGSVRPERFALLFGSEGHGIAPQWIEACDRRLTIPMQGGTDSLNVAVAAGIFLHHFCG
jgi:tRNA G18 (ribose-2'-O)-methylase SpoU